MRRPVILKDWIRRPPKGGVAVVIDVLRFSTTVCALLSSGRRAVRIMADVPSLLGARDLDFSDVFSEKVFRSRGRRFDNSPHQVFQYRAVRRPAYVTTYTGAKAVFASKDADSILVGCFANFGALVRRLKRTRRVIRLLPAASPTPHPGALEDELCAEAVAAALRGDSQAGDKALLQLRQTPRVAQFLRAKPEGDRDLAYCLKLDRLPVLPELSFSADGAVCRARKGRR